MCDVCCCFFFFSSRRRHTRCLSDWSSDVCSSDLQEDELGIALAQSHGDDGFGPIPLRGGTDGGQAGGDHRGMWSDGGIGFRLADGGEVLGLDGGGHGGNGPIQVLLLVRKRR